MGNTQTKQTSCDDAVNLNHFRLLRVVGKGAFGKVRIVERKDTGLTFALKYIRKDEVVRSESVRNIIRERRMLEHLNHPFLCNLRYSFQDIEYIYLVVDLMNGGDLRFHISRKCFTEEAIRFWISELACALRYIHGQGIVHRDLKPDNVLLDSKGHVHLADFNVASDFKPTRPLTSKSGTLAYLAPEVFDGSGYLSEVDWWSLGVTFYECIYSKRPFDGRNHHQLGECIMRAQPKYFVTNPPVTVPCLHAMGALMEKDRSRRIGAVSFESFTTHPFFADIDFDALERQEISPIFVPSSDKTNFDATYDLEELLLEEAPLEARARRQKPRAELKEDATPKEIREDELYRIIETMFEPFDYTLVKYEGTAAAAIEASTNPEEQLPPTVSRTNPAHSRHPSQARSGSVSPSLTEKSYNPSNASDTYSPLGETIRSIASKETNGHSGIHSASPPPPLQRPPTSQPQNYQPPSLYQRHPGVTRKTSKGGGVQMVLGEAGSWSTLADHSGISEGTKGKPAANGGMFSFLKGKKGRERSPKPTEPGVLGKEGARQIIS
ncbi:AGC/YANK protein kinase [Coccidioides immitis RS]|uniref:AGC/YANK protein kinase n=2 Tax=Coccidioides immitis TaxID=5501 RepID=J3KIP1_COCIM|nr:AGC/YANK protein kinase [Coccidioides immitis RS]EAS35850.3 AGC/YANK protein kinase [Coccidioides immitis RS]KMP01139.1 serine/threonine-protein kinase Sgk1 [Coccidioides immitis RMSCC 2394]